jgi:hypothetical protein
MNLESAPISAPIAKGTLAIMDREYRFVKNLESGKEALYRYKTETGEGTDIIESEPVVASRLRSALQTTLKKVNGTFAVEQRARQ